MLDDYVAWLEWDDYHERMTVAARVAARLVDRAIHLPADLIGRVDGNAEYIFPLSCYISQLPGVYKTAKRLGIKLNTGNLNAD